MESLTSLDPSDPTLFRDWSFEPVFAALRREDPVHLTPHGPHGPFWSITRLDDIARVERDWSTFSSAGNIIIGDVPADFDLPAFATSDPPEHTRDRRAAAGAVSPARIAQLEAPLRHVVTELLERLPVDEPFDWARAVSSEITAHTIALLLDLPPSLRHRLAFWCEAVTATPAPGAVVETEQEREEAIASYRDLLLSRWPGAEGNASSGGLLACLARDPSTADVARSPKRLLAFVSLIAGATEAANGALSGGVLAFAQHPAQWERLTADHSLLGSAIGEIVRWQTPVLHMRRTTLRDTEIAGRLIEAGSRVVLWYCSANRDEHHFDAPGEFRLGRPRPHRHAGFGFGVHRCFGRGVAMLELRVLWEETLARFSHLEVTEPPKRLTSNFSSGYERLMVKAVRRR